MLYHRPSIHPPAFNPSHPEAQVGWQRVLGVLRLLLMLGMVAGFGSGCSTMNYYSQAVRGHLEIQSKRVKITQLLKREDLDPKLRDRLQRIQELTAFATAELDLPAGRNYCSYADLGRAHVVWTVHATPEFSLTSRRWWYPFVGRLKYRGFFQQADAEAFAARLRKEGEDVYVGGVDAYSTLGWFRDPVLNTFVNREDTALAELVFHELAHRKYFRGGDTDFNEAFATFVAELGVRKWIETKDASLGLRSRYEQVVKRERVLAECVQETRAKLKELYVQADPKATGSRSLTSEQKSEIASSKAKILQQLRDTYRERTEAWKEGGTARAWLAGPLNNAQLNTVATYYDLVPQFELLFEQNHRDLETFFREVRRFHPSTATGGAKP